MSLFGLASAWRGTLEVTVKRTPVVGLDPHVVAAFSSFAVSGQIYNGLIEASADLQVERALAESWEVPDDGLTCTLRDDRTVMFTPEEPSAPFLADTADDVLYRRKRVTKKGPTIR